MTRKEIPDEYLREIGRVIVLWNEMESLLDLMLVLLSGMDITMDRSYIHLPHLTLRQKADSFLAFVEIDSRESNNERLILAKTVHREMMRLNDARNTIVHHNWLCSDKGVFRANITARGKLTRTLTLVKVAELEILSSQISAVIREFIRVTAYALPKRDAAKGAVAKALTQHS